MSDAEITDRDPDDMSLEELREEYQAAQETVDYWEPYEGQEEVWDRSNELWKELRNRSDVDRPECNRCGCDKWSQSPGDPVVCHGCGRSAGSGMEESVHDAWDRIVTGHEGCGGGA